MEEVVFIIVFATGQESVRFQAALLSRGVLCYRPYGTYEVQGVGVGPEALLEALAEAGCAPIAGAVCSGVVERWNGPAEAPYGIQWGEPWGRARDIIERKS